MRLHLPLFVIVALLCPTITFGAEPEKVVRLVWFPRFSPDNKLLASAHGSWDAKEAGEVRIWEAATGRIKYVLKQPRGIRCVAFSPKSNLLASGGYGRSIALFDPQMGKLIREWKAQQTVENLEFHPDGSHLFSALGDGSIRIWDVETGKETGKIIGIHKGEIWGMTASPDGKLVATAGQDGKVCLVDVASAKVLYEFQHPGANGVAFTSDGKQLAAGFGDSLIRVYDVDQGTELYQLLGHEGGSITDLQFGAKDKVLVSAGFDKTVRVWDVSDPEAPELKQTLPAHDHFAFGVALSHDGKLLASGGWDDRIKVWDAETFKEKWSWDRKRSSK